MNTERKALLLAAGGTLLLQLYLCYFFSFGQVIPMTSDVSPSQYPHAAFRLPPTGFFLNAWWLGYSMYPATLTPHSLLSNLPMWWFFTLLYPLCGAIGVLTFYLLLRELKLPPMAAIVGGVMFGWQGHLMSNIYGGHFAPIMMLAFFPLAVWASLRAARPGGWRYALGGGVVTGWVVAMGGDQGALAALLVGAVYLAAAGRAGWRRHASDAVRILLKLGATVALAVLVALPQLQMLATFTGGEMKIGGAENPRAQYAWATQWSWPPEETLQFLVPGYFGWRTGFNEGPYWGRIGGTEGWEQTHQGFRNFTLESCIIGTLPFVLLCVGVWWGCRKRNGFAPFTDEQKHHARFFAIAAGVTYLLSLGKYTPVHWWFYQIPYMSTWRNPAKFLIVLTNFCFLVLAAYGAHAVIELFRRQEPPLDAPRKNLRRWLLAGIGALVVTLLATVGSMDSHQQTLARTGYTKPEMDAIFSTKLTTVFVALAVLGAAAWGLGLIKKLKPERRTVAAAALLVALCAGQMYWVHTHFLEPFNARNAYRSNPLLEKIAKSPDPVRVKFLSQDGLLHFYLSHVFVYHDIATIDMPAASRVPDDLTRFFGALQQQPLRLWQLAGVKYLATVAQHVPSIVNHPLLRDNIAAVHPYQAAGSRLDDITVQPVADLTYATHALIELKDYLPKALYVPNLEVLDTDDALARRLAAADWNPRASLLTTRASAPALPLPSAARRGSAKLLRYSQTLIEIETETDSGGYLFINDHHETAWHATINGQPAPIFRANLLMRGLTLPAGAARVVLRYAQPAWPNYLSIAICALIGLTLLAARKRP